MDTCTSCGGRLDECNESEIVCHGAASRTAGRGWMKAASSILTISIANGMNSLSRLLPHRGPARQRRDTARSAIKFPARPTGASPAFGRPNAHTPT